MNRLNPSAAEQTGKPKFKGELNPVCYFGSEFFKELLEHIDTNVMLIKEGQSLEF